MAKTRAGRSTTIAIIDRLSSEPRKITKIVPYKDGGFGVLVPYHTARKGYLAKYSVDYRKKQMMIHRSECIEYAAEDRVKLSFHKDGFVQFSGEQPGKIVSGRNQETGEPKGLGVLLEHPLFRPIMSGPTFGLSVWGLQDFESIQGSPSQDTTIFTEEDYYYRGCTPDSWNAYLLETFIFPKHYWAGTRNRDGRFKLSLAFNAFEASGAVLDFTVIPVASQPILLGLMVSRFRHKFPSSSGFSLTSPSDRKQGEPIANSLMAIYPDFMEDTPTQTLDYQDKDNA
jgi:hypothetical protein